LQDHPASGEPPIPPSSLGSAPPPSALRLSPDAGRRPPTPRGLSDPARSRVVLIGSSTYDHFPALPSVGQNLTGLQDALAEPALWGLPPAACRTVHNAEQAMHVHRAVRDAALEVDVDGLLLVYFAGHGVIDVDTGELHLAIPHTDPDSAFSTAVPYDWIRRTVGQSRSNRRVVILDCCYAGRAIRGLSAGSGEVADRVEIDRSCVMVAASANRMALAPPDEPYTAFTGALISVLRGGVPGGSNPLELNTIFEELVRVQRMTGRPVPELRARNGGERIPIVINLGTPLPPEKHETPPAPSSYAGRIFRGIAGEWDPDLAEATIAVLVHTAGEGAIGIRLDQPSDRSPAELIGERSAQVLGTPPVFEGGPVRDVLIPVAAVKPGNGHPSTWRHVIGNLFVVPSDTDLEAEWQSLEAVYLFAGYVGWRPQLLEAEIRRHELVEQPDDLARWLTGRLINGD
jgi:hypothetical protein